MKPERVVVGVDFDDASREAARWALHRFLPDLDHVLVHALDLRDPPRYLGITDSDEVLADARREADRRLTELREELGDAAGGEVRKGRPDEVLSAVADESDAGLIVVGRGSEGSGLLGSTAERLVNTASVPVLMVPDAPGTAPEQLLVAIDDSPETAEVLAWAGGLADRHDARVTVTHVFQPTFAGLGGVVSGAGSHQELKEDQRDQARAWLEEEVREAGLAPEHVRLEVREGDPARQILDEARAPRPDIIIIGSRGPGAVEKALLGSVASSVLRGASRPVLVVRR
ncbi:MAG: universal stress protein [Longimicrobiales bacterium]